MKTISLIDIYRVFTGICKKKLCKHVIMMEIYRSFAKTLEEMVCFNWFQ